MKMRRQSPTFSTDRDVAAGCHQRSTAPERHAAEAGIRRLSRRVSISRGTPAAVRSTRREARAPPMFRDRAGTNGGGFESPGRRRPGPRAAGKSATIASRTPVNDF